MPSQQSASIRESIDQISVHKKTITITVCKVYFGRMKLRRGIEVCADEKRRLFTARRPVNYPIVLLLRNVFIIFRNRQVLGHR